MVKCAVLKPFGAYVEYKVGEIAELSEGQAQQLQLTKTVELINSVDTSPNKMCKRGRPKKLRG